MTYEQVVKQPGWGDSQTFAAAIEPMAIARHLIDHTDKHRERLLANSWIIWTWSGKPLVKNGRACMGITKIMPKLMQDVIREFFNVDDGLDGDFSDEHIAEDLYTPPAPQFLVQLCAASWGRLAEKQRIALVDHELCHMDLRDGKPKLRPHDLAEFTEIVERHGIWDMDTAQFATALQPHLPGLAGAALKQAVRDTQALCDAPITVKPALHGDPALGRAFDMLKQAADDSGTSVTVSGGGRGPVTLTPETRKDIDRLLKHDDDGIAGRIGQAVGE